VNTFPTGDWGEVVTRYPYENVGMDHLLSMENRIYELGYECDLKRHSRCYECKFCLVLREQSLI